MKPAIEIMGKLFSTCSHVLTMILHVQISVALFLNECPEKLIWTLRAKQLCGVEDKYMCLYDTNERSFRELCKESPEFHRPGNVFVISGNLQYFAGRPCYANRYQPHKWWTNGSSECQYLKSSCNGEGQVPYDNGTIASDRKCRCDYTNYYTFVNRTRNKCHCDPIEEDCSCYRKRCNEGQVLTPDYGCVGVHQWTGRYVCPEYKQPKITDDNKMQQITICPGIEKDLSGTVHQSHARIAVTLTSGVLMILGLMTTIAFLINRNTRKEMTTHLDYVWSDLEELKKNLKCSGKEMTTHLDYVWSDLEELKENLKCSEQINRQKKDWEMTDKLLVSTRANDYVRSNREKINIQIKDWEMKDEMFVSTRASDYAIECLQDNSCVTLTAPSGEGKSFIARHTALFLKKKGYNIIPVNSPTDIRDYYQPGEMTVFIVDDIGGNFTANQQQIDTWKQLLPVINTIIADQCCKIIVSCRSQVFNDEKFNALSPFKSCECNLRSNYLSLTPDEQTTIAKTYINTIMQDIDDLSFNCDCFPLLCSLYHEKEDLDVNEFFNRPFYVYKCELDRLSEHGDEGNYKICSLALCVLFNNQLNEKWFHGNTTDEQRQIIQDTCEACNVNSIPKAKLKKALDTLDGTFICKYNGIYRTVHDKLFDFLAHYFGQKMIECLIDHGDSGLINERFIWHNSPDDQICNIDFIIEIPGDCLESYLKRLINDWSAGKVADVFSNNNMNVSSFRKQLLQHLLKLDQSQQVTLANTKDTVIPKEEYGASYTPLVRTCYHGYTNMVEWLLHNDLYVDQYRNNRVTGLIMASQEGHTDIVKLLLLSEKIPNVDLCDQDGCSPLYLASKHGHTYIVKVLLEKNPNVDLCNNAGWSPLNTASLMGHINVVNLLLEKNLNVDLCNNAGWSPLNTASLKGHINVVNLLLEKNPNVDLCNKNGFCPLNTASQKGYADVVKLLLEKNPNVDLCNKDGFSPLNTASQKGYVDVVKLLLEKNANVDLCNKNGWSPLNSAILEGHTDVVKLLLEKNPNVDLCDKNGWSPLNSASQKGYADVVKLLLEKNANVDLCNIDGFSPLTSASLKGYADVVKLLLEKNAKVDICNKDGFSPLNSASLKGHTDVVKLLLEKNPNVDLCDKDGFSPLKTESLKGPIDVVKLLLETNPNVDLCDDNGFCPLNTASQKGHTDVVKLLLEKNANVDLCNKNGFSPLNTASQKGHTDVVKLLLEKNPNVDLCTDKGFSPLINSCSSNQTSIIQLLMKHKLNINAQTYDGGSALYFSALNGNKEITELLLENNADCNICIQSKQSLEDTFTKWPGYSLYKGKQSLFDSLVNNTSLIVTDHVRKKSVDYAFDVVAGSSPLHIACFMGRTGVVSCLLDHNANIHMTKEDGSTPLFYACEVGHSDIVHLLLDKGADTQICRLNGETPVSVATDNEHSSIVIMLTNHTKKEEIRSS